MAAVGLIASAVAFDSQTAILGLSAINGALLAWASPLPPLVPAALVAAGAIALMLDSVPAIVSVTETLMVLGATVFSATAVFGLLVVLSGRLKRPWQALGRRIAGSWAAASAILVLALRLAT
jgi:urease accessory protein